MKKITIKFNSDFVISAETDDEETIAYYQNTPVETMIKASDKVFMDAFNKELQEMHTKDFVVEITEVEVTPDESEVDTSKCETTMES